MSHHSRTQSTEPSPPISVRSSSDICEAQPDFQVSLAQNLQTLMIDSKAAATHYNHARDYRSRIAHELRIYRTMRARISEGQQQLTQMYREALHQPEIYTELRRHELDRQSAELDLDEKEAQEHGKIIEDLQDKLGLAEYNFRSSEYRFLQKSEIIVNELNASSKLNLNMLEIDQEAEEFARLAYEPQDPIDILPDRVAEYVKLFRELNIAAGRAAEAHDAYMEHQTAVELRVDQEILPSIEDAEIEKHLMNQLNSAKQEFEELDRALTATIAQCKEDGVDLSAYDLQGPSESTEEPMEDVDQQIILDPETDQPADLNAVQTTHRDELGNSTAFVDETGVKFGQSTGDETSYAIERWVHDPMVLPHSTDDDSPAPETRTWHALLAHAKFAVEVMTNLRTIQTRFDAGEAWDADDFEYIVSLPQLDDLVSTYQHSLSICLKTDLPDTLCTFLELVDYWVISMFASIQAKKVELPEEIIDQHQRSPSVATSIRGFTTQAKNGLSLADAVASLGARFMALLPRGDDVVQIVPPMTSQATSLPQSPMTGFDSPREKIGQG